MASLEYTLPFSKDLYANLANTSSSSGQTRQTVEHIEELQTHLRDMASLLQEHASFYQEQAGNESAEVSQQMETEAEQLNEQVSKVDGMYKRTMDLANTQVLFAGALENVYNRLPQNFGGFIEDVTADNYLSKKAKFPFNEVPVIYEEQKTAYLAKAESQRFNSQSKQLQSYLRFRNAIHTKGPNREEDMPDIDTFFSDFEADDEMVVEKAKVSYKCPISNSLLVDPVTNPRCNHTFSKASVADMFMHAGSSVVSCPVPACSAMMHKGEMHANPDMAEAVERYRARLAKETQRQTATLERI